MNKLSIFFVCLGVGLMLFTLGYKIGDSRGYDDGFNDGYRYDCKAEIKTLYGHVKTLSKAVDKTDSALLMKQKRDSVDYYNKAKAKFSADSAKNWKRARSFNDSLGKALGKHSPIMLMDPAGHLNPFGCMMDPDYMKLRECKELFEK